MQRPQVKIIQQQEESINDERQLSEEETKAFLYKNHPDLYKRMYPDIISEKKPIQNYPIHQQKRINQDIQKSDKVYTYDKYDNASSDDGGFSYKIQITTDMDIKR